MTPILENEEKENAFDLLEEQAGFPIESNISEEIISRRKTAE